MSAALNLPPAARTYSPEPEPERSVYFGAGNSSAVLGVQMDSSYANSGGRVAVMRHGQRRYAEMHLDIGHGNRASMAVNLTATGCREVAQRLMDAADDLEAFSP